MKRTGRSLLTVATAGSNPVCTTHKYFSDGMADKRMNNPGVNPHYTS